jgi:choline-sulfatase
MNHLQDGFSEEFIRRVIAGYYGLITHTDAEIGQVMDEMTALGLMDDTRIIYTSDHGEAAGHHGILGKANHYEHGIGVPLLMAGPSIPKGRVIEQRTSHVDLFPTIVGAMAGEFGKEDADLPGISLWPAITGDEVPRAAFAEYHAMGSRNSGFAYRKGDHKLIYHVGMPRQLFDLAADPREENDLLQDSQDHPTADELEAELRRMVDPEEIDARSKSEQAAHMGKFGGIDAVRKEGLFSRSPIPGAKVELEQV